MQGTNAALLCTLCSAHEADILLAGPCKQNLKKKSLQDLKRLRKVRLMGC